MKCMRMSDYLETACPTYTHILFFFTFSSCSHYLSAFLYTVSCLTSVFSVRISSSIFNRLPVVVSLHCCKVTYCSKSNSDNTTILFLHRLCGRLAVSHVYLCLRCCVVLLLSPSPTQPCLTGYHGINPWLRLTEYLHVPVFYYLHLL